jgi:hypothetical protein
VWYTQAIASWAKVAPTDSAMGFNCSTLSRMVSKFFSSSPFIPGKRTKDFRKRGGVAFSSRLPAICHSPFFAILRHSSPFFAIFRHFSPFFAILRHPSPATRPPFAIRPLFSLRSSSLTPALFVLLDLTILLLLKYLFQQEVGS